MTKFYKSGNICYKVEIYDTINMLNKYVVLRITHCCRPRPKMLLYIEGTKAAIIDRINDMVAANNLVDNIADYTKDLLTQF